MRVPRRHRPGRPPGPLPESRHPLTRRIRRLVDEAHLANLREAAHHTGLPYATLRDLYAGRTTSPGLTTLQHIARAYALPLEWFTDDEAASPQLAFPGELPPDPEFGHAGRGRRIVIPLAAWPLARCFLRLEQELLAIRPHRSRPVMGAANHPDECRQRLTAFLLGPLLEAQRQGLLVIAGADPPYPGSAALSPERQLEWITILRDLGRFWERTLSLSLLR